MGYFCTIALLLLTVQLMATGCGTVRSIVHPETNTTDSRPIANPFNEYHPGSIKDPADTMILRTKKDGNSIEVEIPRSNQDMSDFVIPISPTFSSATHGDRSPASEQESGQGNARASETPFAGRDAGPSDREITHSFSKGSTENESQRQEIEQELGLVRTEEATREKQKSYLASLDQIKQFYRSGRYEAALLITDDMIREYPTSPKLYEMRGTLFERVGQPELAIKAWKQALRFKPDNEPLRRFIERKERKRSVASP